MATGSGAWIGGDDYRAQVEVTVTSQTDTTATIKVVAKLQSLYGYANYTGSTPIKGWAGLWDEANKYRWSSAANCSQFSNNQTITFKTQSWTVTKTKASQTVWGYSDIEAGSGAGGYSNTKTQAQATVTIGAKTSYTIAYNANGGSGAPSSQTKWYGETLTLSSTKPTRTGYTFKGWATSSGGSVAYAAGASYTANAAATLYAVWEAITYAVTYNANGGSGAPSAQTKTYGVTLKLSTTVPTRTNYDFLGWSTSQSATTATYAAGANYTANAAATLYAVWKLAYTAPSITSLTAVRSNSSGTAQDDGTYCKVTAAWKLGTTSGNAGKQAVIKIGSVSQTVTLSGTSGTVTQTLGTFSTETSFNVSVTVTDTKGGSAARTTVLTPAFFTFDLAAGGRGVGIGQAAPTTGLGVGFDTSVAGNLTIGAGAAATQYQLKAKTPARTGQVLFVGGGKKTDGDVNGTVVGLGAGGLTLVGGGEYAQNRYNVGDLNDGAENLYLGADQGVYLESNGNTIANRKTWVFNTDGRVVYPTGGSIYLKNATQDATATSLSATTDQVIYQVRDKNTVNTARTIVRQTTAGNLEHDLEIVRAVNGSNVWNNIAVGIRPTGEKYYYISDQNAFRSAIGLGATRAALPLNSAVTPYDEARTPYYTKQGNLVNLQGAVKPTSQVAAGGTVTIGTLPSGFRPPYAITTLCQGSGNTLWLLTISGAGVVAGERYRWSGQEAMPTSAWLTFCITFAIT